ncbi:MAG: type II toxin-antitoxin system HicA family toxin [Candidatus Pacearchaeota archaeon]
MAKFPQISGRELCKILEKLDFEMIYTKGSHIRFKHPDGRRTVVPVHADEKIGKGLLREILKQAKLSREEFEKLI